jgi:hypothetical protein
MREINRFFFLNWKIIPFWCILRDTSQVKQHPKMLGIAARMDDKNT